MMENRLDKLFRNKLSGHEEAPSSQAWQKVHLNLKSKKRRLWIQRISIAASIFLVATVGFIAYHMLHDVGGTTEMTNVEAPGKEKATIPKNVENKTIEKRAEENSMKEPHVVSEAEIQNLESKQKKSIQDPSADLTEKPLDLVEMKEEVVENRIEELIDEGDKQGNNGKESMEKTVLDADKALALNTESEMDEKQDNTGNMPVIKQKKSYKQLKVIYKANKDSKLVASGNETIINKGINKITEFSDEYLLTEVRKTKLRNTKEDLLALNFGKLLNKSNKDLEN